MTSATHPPYWHANQQRLATALLRSGATHAASDILEILRTQGNAFWLATPDSFVLSEIIDYPRKRIINWSLAGGNLADMLAFEKVMTDFAVKAGCVQAQVTGREGWQRVLKDYHRNAIVLAKELGA